MSYAVGLYAKAICDRCGFKLDYLDLRTEPLTKARVCEDCLDEYPPEFYAYRGKVADAVSLRYPRPEQNAVTANDSAPVTPTPGDNNTDATDGYLSESGDDFVTESGDDEYELEG